MLFFAFDPHEAPDSVVEPVLIAFWSNRPNTGGRLFHIKLDQASPRYYGHTRPEVMAGVGEALRQANIPFTELDELQLPERYRQRLEVLRRR